MFFVYILYSKSTDTFYKGQTANLVNRIKRHNDKLEKFTKKGAPWMLMWSTTKPSRSEAIKLESKLKNLSRARTIQFMLKYHQEIEGPDEMLLLQQLSGC